MRDLAGSVPAQRHLHDVPLFCSILQPNISTQKYSKDLKRIFLRNGMEKV
jgi:hypothetical protein